jgi:hypothetical protein
VIDYALLKAKLIEAAVTSVNATLELGADQARKDAPVRKVFKGGRQTVRFKTADEIEADRGIRSRLGLAPEILATSEGVGRVQRSGRHPGRGTSFTQRVPGATDLFSGEPVGREVQFGFARTIAHPSSDKRLNAKGLTRAERGHIELRRNRANTFMPFGEDVRLLGRQSGTLEDRSNERFLTGRGRYELKTERAGQPKRARVDLATGRITFSAATRDRLGGGLRGTIRIERATPDTYPVIKGSLVAGDEEHDYAKYQELGTRHNPAHPFVRPRLPEFREELPRQLTRALGRLGR